MLEPTAITLRTLENSLSLTPDQSVHVGQTLEFMEVQLWTLCARMLNDNGNGNGNGNGKDGSSAVPARSGYTIPIQHGC